MNLFKIGEMTLNMDRVNGIQDHAAPASPGAEPGQSVIRVLFDDAHIDLAGSDARVLRRWIRHNARNLAPRKSEDGEDLVSPEDQLKRSCDHLVELVDRVRPKDSTVRGAAHRLAGLIDDYITGQLAPMPAPAFERYFAAPRAEAQTFPEPPAG